MITIDLDTMNASQLARLYNVIAELDQMGEEMGIVLQAGIANCGLVDFWREIMRQY